MAYATHRQRILVNRLWTIKLKHIFQYKSFCSDHWWNNNNILIADQYVVIVSLFGRMPWIAKRRKGIWNIFGVKTTFKDSEAESAKVFVRERSIPVQCPGNDMDLYSFWADSSFKSYRLCWYYKIDWSPCPCFFVVLAMLWSPSCGLRLWHK